jgi:hypothetical protein
MRLVMLVGTMFWLLHNFLVGSFGGTVLEGVLVVVNLVTLVRMHHADRADSLRSMG